MGQSGYELFGRKEMGKKPVKPDSPPEIKPVMTEKQKLAMNRDDVIHHFAKSWAIKYNMSWLRPPDAYAIIEVPIEQALKKGYTANMLKNGINGYLSSDFVGYREQSHHIKYFTRDMQKWVIEGQKVKEPVKGQTVSDDEVRKLNEKYGLLRKGEGWIDEDGSFYLNKEDAIKACERRKRC